MSLSVIILAAGQGTRMYSSKPKVLHEIGGKPMLAHVIELAQKLEPVETCVVVGHQAESVKTQMSDYAVQWILQAEQLGTGHAVQQAIDAISADRVLVLYGDTPLTRVSSLEKLLNASATKKLGLLTVEMKNPTGYGRIVRDSTGKILKIVEEKDASDEIKKITEGNTGILCAETTSLKRWLNNLENNNQQREYYLTDCIAACVAENEPVASVLIADENEVAGVNNKLQLEQLERVYQLQQAEALLIQGVTLADKNRVDIRGALACGKDVFIDVNCVFQGDVQLGDGVSIGPNCFISNTEIQENTSVLANCVLEDSRVGESCNIGPFSRLRPGAEMSAHSKAGNFVEIKNAKIGKGAKVNHLSYVGDAELGEDVNIGAGTITCNYDGANKHKTIIGDNVFIGSNTALVAPVTVADDATIGAGSTITRDAPEAELTLERSKQITIKGWQRPKKEKR
ncbi:MAG TPA: UDP-N-acetylglucosamine diphosphorylase/glucosamine-1-phosphate N-acetyltransferase [Chromatiales bacterium]|nr:UDP-N-acetylglucosamine diphosphorylase/glucosamine-1-phosphate N-acetyltransferase [Thiotrichales bacterium]HIP69688.1 UDP-N-acetylglucosamine diphosphorylase/glucosamine-1-phosphate N-acetyltransferase [Chromatiales bacterium]